MTEPQQDPPAAAEPGTGRTTVRRAHSQDCPAVGLVQAAVWRTAYANVVDPELIEMFQGPAFAAVWQRSLENPPDERHVLLVALDDTAASTSPDDSDSSYGGRVVGFAALGPSPDPDADDVTAELLVMGVHPGHRRRGHGSRLLNAAAQTARELSFGWLTTWLLGRAEDDRAFLATAGFAPDRARRERVVGVDAAGRERTVLEVRLAVHLGDQGSDHQDPSEVQNPSERDPGHAG